jgi:hypothetical protein
MPFQWLPRAGCAPGAVYPPHVVVPKPLELQDLDGAALVWLPLARLDPARRALAALPSPALLLFPARDEDVPRVLDAWLGLYAEAPKAIEEAVLQVVDDQVQLRAYVAAEEALWALVYRLHPHKEDPGILPRALAEARWLADVILDDDGYAEHAEFLTLAALEAVARELLVTVRRAEMLHLRDHLRGQDTVSGW